jgi:hypothetical protein
MSSLKTFDIQEWDQPISTSIQTQAIERLEQGNVLFFPALPFKLTPSELKFLNPSIVDTKAKNISYDLKQHSLKGALLPQEELELLKQMMHRFASFSRHFMDLLFPHYTPSLIQGKTSFRPVEISGRKSSYRKDDTLLHVDSFPSNPTRGTRILRVFSNINQEGTPRVWRVGEPFEHVAETMLPRVSAPIPGFAPLLKLLGITKNLRSSYDHYMLHIHNAMKRDRFYQKNVPQEEIRFPSGSSWIVYTDQASHAAMSGQHVLEQTFHLPVKGLYHLPTSPLHILEKALQKTLV